MRVVNLGPDPSLAYRPDSHEKDKSEFRNFESGALFDRVFNTYKLMHTYQTLDFVKQKHLEWANCNHFSMSMMENIDCLDELVDESDPDVDFPNSFHAFQTAEGIRKEHPDKGERSSGTKVTDVALVCFCEWAVVGDTFPVGCKFQNSIVFRNSTFEGNPDGKNPALNTEFGIYEPKCGLDNILMSWGHDEYLYRVMKFNKCTIPEEGLYMIRFHSFYPWHSNGNYMHLCNEKDLQMLPWVKEFNKFDLYTKSTELPDVGSLRPYYQSLIDKYCPGILRW
uniref:Inositol oxygenase n=1 Tax=Sinocyclocheilus anshuiensis TaxID=1608454 RepID=A0A671LGJ8_9TELE